MCVGSPVHASNEDIAARADISARGLWRMIRFSTRRGDGTSAACRAGNDNAEETVCCDGFSFILFRFVSLSFFFRCFFVLLLSLFRPLCRLSFVFLLVTLDRLDRSSFSTSHF